MILLYSLVIFSLQGEPVYIVRDLGGEHCLLVQERVMKMRGASKFYTECIAQSSTHSL